MKKTQDKNYITKRFRRILRRVKLEAKNAAIYYPVSIISLLLIVVILVGILLLRCIGYQLTGKTIMLLFAATIFLTIVLAISATWGMMMLSLTRRKLHVKEYFPTKHCHTKDGEDLDISPEIQTRLSINSLSTAGTDAVFLLSALFFWIFGDRLLRLCYRRGKMAAKRRRILSPRRSKVSEQTG